jgi:hypothetical protein
VIANLLYKVKKYLYRKGIELSKYLCTNSHRILTRLITANIVLDGIAIAIWAVFPVTQCSIYRLGFSIIGTEAAIGACLFALTLFGLIKRKKWAPFLAIVLTVNQRVFSNFAFFPNPADIQMQPLILAPNVATLIWSIIIIYFTCKDINAKNDEGNHPKISQGQESAIERVPN